MKRKMSFGEGQVRSKRLKGRQRLRKLHSATTPRTEQEESDPLRRRATTSPTEPDENTKPPALRRSDRKIPLPEQLANDVAKFRLNVDGKNRVQIVVMLAQVDGEIKKIWGRAREYYEHVLDMYGANALCSAVQSEISDGVVSARLTDDQLETLSTVTTLDFKVLLDKVTETRRALNASKCSDPAVVAIILGVSHLLEPVCDEFREMLREFNHALPDGHEQRFPSLDPCADHLLDIMHLWQEWMAEKDLQTVVASVCHVAYNSVSSAKSACEALNIEQAALESRVQRRGVPRWYHLSRTEVVRTLLSKYQNAPSGLNFEGGSEPDAPCWTDQLGPELSSVPTKPDGVESTEYIHNVTQFYQTWIRNNPNGELCFLQFVSKDDTIPNVTKSRITGAMKHYHPDRQHDNLRCAAVTRVLNDLLTKFRKPASAYFDIEL